MGLPAAGRRPVSAGAAARGQRQSLQRVRPGVACGVFGRGSLTCVASEISYLCRRCGERHDGLPMSYRTDAPAYWDPSLADDESSMLDQEQCIIKAGQFFIHGRLVIPVTDAPTGTKFDWGVWVSLSRDNFARALSLWTTAGREQELPYFGWLSTELPLYEPSTLLLKTRVHTQAVGKRPLVEVEPTDHPLAVEQHTGITLARVQEIAETLLHRLPASGFLPIPGASREPERRGTALSRSGRRDVAVRATSGLGGSSRRLADKRPATWLRIQQSFLLQNLDRSLDRHRGNVKLVRKLLMRWQPRAKLPAIDPATQDGRYLLVWPLRRVRIDHHRRLAS